MKITIVGAGYVGLVASACFADMGNDVVCVDIDESRIEKLKQCKLPIYEPGLEELVQQGLREKRLIFSHDLCAAVKCSDICILAVGTPAGNRGECDLSYVVEAAKTIAQSMNGYKVIVDKSTVPVGTAEMLMKLIAEYTDYPFDIVSNPEFLKQGNAVDDFMHPDRVIIGADSERASRIMQDLYAPFFRTGNRVIVMDVKSAEMTKYAANAFLATKISFMNEIANLCESVGADAEMVRVGLSTDTRIGKQFLFPGLGYGGSCFPKDVKALIKIGSERGMDMSIISAVDQANIRQRERFIEKIYQRWGKNLSHITFAVWGLSFKPRTNDMRESPAIDIIQSLLESNARVQVYDPKAMETAQHIFGERVVYSANALSALDGADCLLLLTEWNEFRRLDYESMKTRMNTPVLFDGRNLFEPKKLTERGIEYHSIGRI